MPTQDAQQGQIHGQHSSDSTPNQPILFGGLMRDDATGHPDAYHHRQTTYTANPLTGYSYYAGVHFSQPIQQEAQFSAPQPFMMRTGPSLQNGYVSPFYNPTSFSHSINGLSQAHIVQAPGSRQGGAAASVSDLNEIYRIDVWSANPEGSTAASNQRNKNPCSQCQRAQVRVRLSSDDISQLAVEYGV